MAGYVNSWIDAYQSRPAPCISDSVNGVGSGVPGLAPISTCWMWLLIGAVVGSIITKNKKG